MAFLILDHPNKQIYLQTHLWALGRAQDDDSYRANLRLVFAVLLAQWSDNHPELFGENNHLFDIITNENFIKKTYVTTSEKKIYFCSYIGFEKLTSKWAKEKYPHCRGYLCMRIYATNQHSEELDAHTIQMLY